MIRSCHTRATAVPRGPLFRAAIATQLQSGHRHNAMRCSTFVDADDVVLLSTTNTYVFPEHCVRAQAKGSRAQPLADGRTDAPSPSARSWTHGRGT